MDCARFGLSKISIVQDLDHARFRFCKIYDPARFRLLEYSKSGSLYCDEFGTKFEKCVEFGAHARFGNY